jgi:hypothetical protein
MTWPRVARLTRSLLLWSAAAALAQTGSQNGGTSTQAPPPAIAPAPAPAKAQFFGGTVTQLDEHRITVSRTLTGKPAEHHTFLINAKTKITKSVKLKSRVIVRYQRLAQGDVALEVRIRPLTRTPRAS